MYNINPVNAVATKNNNKPNNIFINNELLREQQRYDVFSLSE